MKPDARHALVYALDKGLIEVGTETAIGFFNALPLPDIEADWKRALVCEQPNRVAHNELQKEGYSVRPELADLTRSLDGAFVLLGRNRRVNENRIARAWNACRSGGRIVIAGDKTSGVNALRKWVSGIHQITNSLSKFHAVVFWVEKEGENLTPVPLWKEVDGYSLADGMFSATGPDKGSVILVEHFSDKVRGKVADLGSGWGYLSAQLLNRSERVEQLDLYEADFHAVEAARTNVESENAKLGFNWIDVTSELRKIPYDWVIMNPPFHTGRAAEPDLGKRFIEVAASTLPSGGRLLMVANRNLPYEKILDLKFRRYEKLEERDGFKVIEAVK